MNTETQLYIPEEHQRWLHNQAQRIASTFGYSTADDLVQSAWVWMMSSSAGKRGWWTDGRFNDGLFRLDLTRVLTREAKKDRYKAVPYYEADELRYGRDEVKALLKEMWTWNPLNAHEAEVVVSTSSDPSKGMTLPTKLTDLRLAYAQAVEPGGREDQILFRLYALGETQTTVGQAMGITQQVVGYHATRALNAIVKALNHTSWGRTWSNPGEWNDGPGTRTVRSNAAAIAALD